MRWWWLRCHSFFFVYSAVLRLSVGFISSRAVPELVKECLRPPVDRDRRSRLISLPLMLGHSVVAGRALVVAGMGFVGWTLLSNPFASSAVRIQHERKQQVITTGPCALVRHPMYLGWCCSRWGAARWWAGLFMVPLLVVFVRRTLFEDRML